MTADALNAVCPYYTMYPLEFPLRVLKEHGKRGARDLSPDGRSTWRFLPGSRRSTSPNPQRSSREDGSERNDTPVFDRST